MRNAEPSAGAVTVEVRVLFLSALRDLAGTREVVLSLSEGSTLRAVAGQLAARFGLQAPSGQVMATLNGRGWTQLEQGLDTPLTNGDAIHLFPPVSGG
jgi:molybdopterin converting factor small subunit